MSSTLADPASPTAQSFPQPACRPLGARTRFAVGCGRLAAWLSRTASLGRGQMIGGRVVLAVDRNALQQLSAGLSVVLVTGTNGKTTRHCPRPGTL